MTPRRIASFCPQLAVLVVAAACGPVAIGVGLSSGGGGGGDGNPGAPIVVAEDVPYQPEDDSTLVAVKVSQSAARRVRLRLEYEVGQTRVRVPAANVVRYDLAARAAGAALDQDPNGNFVVDSSSSGQTYFLLWNHAADLAQVERRGVTVFAVFADEALSSPDFAAEGSNSQQLFANRTVGRELGELSEFVLRRQSQNPESAVLVDAVLRDRGGDLAITEFVLEYATTSTTPVENDYVRLPTIVPTRTGEGPEPDGRIRSALTFSFDPLALALAVPLGSYEQFWIRVRHREVYPPFRSDNPPGLVVSAPTVLNLADVQIGFAPRIESASVVDPSSSQSNAGDPGRPWLRLPIALVVANPSSRVAIRVRLTGEYRIDNQTFTLTPYQNGDPLSDVEFDLAPEERRKQYLVWNVVRDEGLGNALVNDPPYSPLRVAELTVKARLLSAGGRPLGGRTLESAANAGFTALNTNPFVGFRDNLVVDAERIWSSGDDVTQATRNLFFTQVPRPTQAQERLLGLDQQFEARQIVPPPPPINFGIGGLNLANGVYDVVATDFDPLVPDCLVWVSDQFYYVTWPANGGPPNALPIAGNASGAQFRGRDPVSFSLGTGANRHYVAVFHTRNERLVGGSKELDVQLKVVVRNPQQVWSVQQTPVATFFLPDRPTGGVPDTDVSPVLGEFDGNGNTAELVLGNLGAEYATTARPGLLHQWTFSVGAGGVVVSAPQAIARPQAPTFEPNRNISRWLMTAWRDGAAARDALVLVRQLDGTASRNRELDVKLLGQSAAGGFATAWTVLTEELSGAAGAFPQVGGVQLEKVFAADLDGSVDGIAGSDLLLVFTQTFPNAERKSDVWLYARREARPAVWRRIMNDVTLQDPATAQAGFGQMRGGEFRLVDVNGDRLLDLLTAEKFVVGSTVQDVQHWNYFSSSLSGVAGRLGALGASAGSALYRSQLPGLLDADQDGYTDVVSGGRLHIANLDGSYTQDVGGFSGGPQSVHRVERMWASTPADAVDIVVSDAANSTQNRIDRLTGLGTGTLSVVSQMSYSFGAAAQVRTVRAMVAPDTATRGVKDLVALTGSGTTSSLQRGRIAGTVLTPGAFWGGSVATSAGLALVRRQPLVAGRGPAEDPGVQDVAVVDAASPGQVVVLESHNGYAERRLVLPSGQIALRIAEGAISSDDLEDLCVLTQQGSVYRVICFVQDADPSRGIGQPAETVTLLQFQQPFNTSAPRSFQFDRGSEGFAEGFLLLDDTAAGSARSEVRFLRPIQDPTGLASRIVRSPLLEGVDVDVDVVVTDEDQDGLVEILGGEVSATSSGLRRVRRNVRPLGQ